MFVFFFIKFIASFYIICKTSAQYFRDLPETLLIPIEMTKHIWDNPFLHKQNGASKAQVVLTLYVMATLVLQRRRQIKRIRV